MTQATLGFSIDSSQASSAAVDLDKLTAAATRTQAAADRLEADAASLGTALGRAGDGATKAKPAVESLGRTFGSQDEHVRSFRMEVERLTLKYQPLAQATKQYEATVAEIGRAHKVGAISAQQMTTALDAERLAFERLKTSATTAGAAVKAANANGRPGAGGNFATANVAAQFQDIAVTSAMGMSPLQIALQQGTQLSAVLGPMGAAGAVKGLGAAFMSVISPISLVTIGLVAGTAALIQYFSTAEDGTEKTSKLFEEQNEVIRRAAELWGDAAPALKAYVDELDRADKITNGRAAGEILAGRELEGVSKNLDAVKRQAIEAFRALQGDQNNAIIVRDLRDAWGDLRERLDGGSATMADLTRVQEELGKAISKYGVSEVTAFSKAFGDLVPNIEKAIEAAEKYRGIWIDGPRNVQDILSGSTFTDGGKTLRSTDFVPINPGRPTNRPSDLAGDPDPTSILNSGGRLTGVPIPGQKPNTFELEKEADAVDDVTKAYRRAQEAQADFWLDLSFQERQAGRSATDQKVAATLGRYGFNENLNSPEANAIRQQIQQGDTKEVIKGFFSDIKSGAMENGGDIGKAIANAALNAASNAMDKAWESVFDQLGTALSGLLTGKGGSSAASAAPGVVSNLLGTAANDNKGFAAPVGAVTRAPLGDIASYAASIRKIESGSLEGNYGALGPVTRNGDRAYGAYQVMGNNIGPWSKEALGKSMTASEFLTDKGAQDAIFNHKFGGYAEKYGGQGAAQAWFGGPGSVGKGGMGTDILGTSGNAYVEKFTTNIGKMGDVAGATTEGLGKLGGGLSKIGESLSTSFFPAAPAAGGGGGGIGGWFSSLFGGGLSAETKAKYTPLTGLFANGTDYAPGGMAMVGERGPELVNLPQGAGVVSNHKLMSALAANNNGGQSGGIAGVRVFVDQDGNWQAKVESIAEDKAKKTSQQSLGGYKQSQQRSGYGDDQKRYMNRKG